MFLLCMSSSLLDCLSCHVFVGRQTNVGLRRSHHIAIVDCLHAGRHQPPLVDDHGCAVDTWFCPGQVEDLATAASGTAAAGTAAKGGTDDGDDSLSQGGDGENEEDEGVDEISMEDLDAVDDTE